MRLFFFAFRPFSGTFLVFCPFGSFFAAFFEFIYMGPFWCPSLYEVAYFFAVRWFENQLLDEVLGGGCF